jgi:hypothetical protein
MTDVKIIAIKDLLTITGVQVVPGLTPKTLSIRGLQFLQASEVDINGIAAPEFMILSDSQILAQVPNGQQNSIISSIAVLAEIPSPTRSSVFLFEAGRTFKGLKGIERLVQMFVKLALQTPGSDKFRPTLGGGLLALAGQNVAQDGQSKLSSSAVSSIGRTRDQIVALQNKVPRIPPDERLLSADVLGVGFDANTTTLALRVAISAQSGQQAVANLTF